jgi:hypothetical protein
MHPLKMDLVSREIGAAVLAAMILVLAVLCWRRFRSDKRPWLFASIAGYNAIVWALFVYGLLGDDGYGWAFLPVMVSTFPWSFLAPVVARGAVGSWIASGLIGNFAFVVICAAINSFLIYLFVRRAVYSRPEIAPSIRS